jgi:Spy/CpxP family protein refolding chaperone
MIGRILLVGVLASAAAFAQRGGGGGGRNGGGMNMPNVGFGPTNKFDRISEMLKLDKDQKKALKETFDGAQKEAAPVHEQIQKARLAVGEAVAEGKGQDEINKAASAEGLLESQMTAIEMRAFAKFVAVLEPEQQQRAQGVYAMMAGIFSGKNWNSN